MEQNDHRTLSDNGKQVLRHFQTLQLTLQQEECMAILPHEALEIEEMNDRFTLWATNIGLFNTAHSSLDYRLRDNEHIRTFADTLLQTLDDKVQEGHSTLC